MAAFLSFTDGIDHNWNTPLAQLPLFREMPSHKRTIKSRGINRVCCGCGKSETLNYLPEPFESAFYSCRSCCTKEINWRENSRYYWMREGGIRNVNYYGKKWDYEGGYTCSFFISVMTAAGYMVNCISTER